MADYTYRESRIVKALESGQTVILESGAANDEIVKVVSSKPNEMQFETTGCIFPKVVQLSDFEHSKVKKYGKALFVTVW